MKEELQQIDDERYDADVEKQWKMSPWMKILTGGWLTLFFDPVMSLLIYGQKLYFILLLPFSLLGAIGWTLYDWIGRKTGFWLSVKDAAVLLVWIDVSIAIFGILFYYLTLIHYYLHICGFSVEFVYGLIGSIVFAAKKGLNPTYKAVFLILLLIGALQMLIRFIRFRYLCKNPDAAEKTDKGMK